MADHDEGGLRRVRVYGMLIALLGIAIFPFCATFSNTFKPESEIFSASATLVPSRLSLGAYVDVWIQIDVLPQIANSFVIPLGTVVLTLLFAIPVAYSCVRNDFMDKRTFLLVVLAAQMLAPVVLIVELFDVISRLGLFNAYLAVIVSAAAFTLPFNIWMLYGYFKTVPVELEESACTDGVNQLQVLMKIVLPLTKPALVTSITYMFLYVWNRLLFVLTLLTNSGKYNIPRGVFSIVGALQTDWRTMFTVSVTGIIPLLIPFAFLEQYIVVGMITGAVKE